MKTQIWSCSLPWWVLACTSLLLTSFADCCCQASQPVITSIRPDGTNVIVQVSIPSEAQRITLESRPRFGEGTWAPLAVAQADGSTGTLTFHVPCTRQTELMRVRADASQPLPRVFYNGTTSFAGPVGASAGSLGPSGGGVVAGGGTPPSNGDTTRPVVESDIWEANGDTLYFFNQYRGLQVIDITAPDNAKVRGTLELPASGEQMYLADSNHVILLANAGCGYGADQSQIFVVSVSNGVPVLLTSLPIGGLVLDSRMVGTALYVASQNYRPVSGTTNETWEWGTSVTSLDLASPEKPAIRSTLWYAGYGNVVNATDTYLFVATEDPTNWWQSLVQIIDITSPDGTMAPVSSIRTAGRVPDKFKLNYTNAVFTSISENWEWASGTGPITKLETFYLPDPRSMGPGGISKLGELELGSGEQLHATRFDGNLVYVVTFFQIDPLWVVDLSDPANPHIAGSVNVPGWSSYISPLGDRLVTVGVESNRVAVSLFDVHDPAQPALLTHILLGKNYSWSDANYDEKAFTVLLDQGLVLVPYNGDTTNGWTSQVQLIDLTRTNLVARGIIHHQSQPRRTAFTHKRILSLSGWELLSIDATDRDQPNVNGDLQLAWSVDRLFAVGDSLIELSGSTGWWGYQTPPAVRVTPLHRHDQILNEVALDNLPVVGASLNDGRLYVAQSPSYWYPVPLDGPGGPAGGPATNPPNFFLTILDASHLPNLSILGQVSVAVDTPGWGGAWNPVWPKPDVLVWAGGGGSYWWWLPIAVPGGVAPTGPTGIAGGVVWPWWGGGGGQLLAFDVSNPASPNFDSEVNLATNNWWSFSQPLSSGTRVYLSHNESEVLTNADNPNGLWLELSELDVIDYADPISPTVRKPVNIPGTLQGLAGEGELLYTVGVHWDTNQVTDWTQWLDASAYDGVAAHLVASLALPDSWPHPVLVLDTNVFLGQPGYSSTTTNVTAPRLETWTLSGSGTFALNGSVELSQPASTLSERAGLLATQETDSSVDLFDDSAPGALSRVGHAGPSGCLWFNLDQADGSLGQGLWIPLGVYGVKEISLGP
jgi:hypothetical protein